MDSKSLPPPAQIPPATIRLSIAPEEWAACLESWLTLANLYLRVAKKELESTIATDSSLLDFLRSFYQAKAQADVADHSLKSSTARELERTCFLLVHRIVLDLKPPPHFLELDFFANFCRVHGRSGALPKVIHELWRWSDRHLKMTIENRKKAMAKAIDPSTDEKLNHDLENIAEIMKSSSDIAALFMVGSDFLDSLVAQHSRSDSLEQRKLIVAVAYLGLLSLASGDTQNTSLLSDHLYSLKASADTAGNVITLIADLATNTSFTAKLRITTADSTKGSERIGKLLDVLDTYRKPSIRWPRKHGRRKPTKGKGKAIDIGGEMHMHRMSLVTQVKDLFPDLGAGFVLKLLDEYNDDVEQVTAHLLDDSLPDHLQDLDRSEEAPGHLNLANGDIEDLVPRSTPPPQESYLPERRNVFDNDEFDRLEYDTSRLHLGKKKDLTSEGNSNKAAILSALAAFDSDDDERDDTYDVDDVGGTVDTAHPDGEPALERETFKDVDMLLFGAYISTPDIFGRTAEVRKSKARQKLKAETGMTDEAIEGWAIMLQRDAKRMRRLEAQFQSFDGRQVNLARTSYREGAEGTETEDSDGGPSSRDGLRGGFRGRGRGRGRGRNVAGAASDPKTGVARDRKEASKGSRANHNRRDQRAKKMARGGFAG